MFGQPHYIDTLFFLFFPYSFLSFFLCRYGCISMHKRQKLYKWCSVPHHQLYTSAVRRCIQGGKSCKPVRQPALQLCAGEISIEVKLLHPAIFSISLKVADNNSHICASPVSPRCRMYTIAIKYKLVESSHTCP